MDFIQLTPNRCDFSFEQRHRYKVPLPCGPQPTLTMQLNAKSSVAATRQAQMTKSNVYHYFENREELLLALLEEESAQWQADLGARLAAMPWPSAGTSLKACVIRCCH